MATTFGPQVRTIADIGLAIGGAGLIAAKKFCSAAINRSKAQMASSPDELDR